MNIAFSARYCLLPLLLAGCATDIYWTKAFEPLPVEHVVHVDFPCGRADLYGCWNAPAGTIELRKGMTPELEKCVRKHEERHAEGDVHPPARAIHAYVDCGDGTRYQPPRDQWQRAM